MYVSLAIPASLYVGLVMAKNTAYVNPAVAIAFFVVGP
jgi:hypothetical protein